MLCVQQVYAWQDCLVKPTQCERADFAGTYSTSLHLKNEASVSIGFLASRASQAMPPSEDRPRLGGLDADDSAWSAGLSCAIPPDDSTLTASDLKGVRFSKASRLIFAQYTRLSVNTCHVINHNSIDKHLTICIASKVSTVSNSKDYRVFVSCHKIACATTSFSISSQIVQEPANSRLMYFCRCTVHF